MNYHDHLKTEYWQEVARKVKSSAGFKCQVCNSPQGIVAHHRTYAHVGDELNHLGDLICLCGKCHTSFHKVEEVNGVRRATVMPDKDRVTSPVPTKPLSIRSKKEMRREMRYLKARVRHEAQKAELERRLVKLAAKETIGIKQEEKAKKKERFNAERIRIEEMDRAVSALYDHNADMPSSFPVTIDSALMAKFTTKAGGITGKTMRALNVPRPPVKGWPARLIGQVITEEQCRAALEGRECRSTARTLNLV